MTEVQIGTVLVTGAGSDSGIVTQVFPRLVNTEFAQRRWAEHRARADEFYGKSALVLDPTDIAKAVVYAADQPPYVAVADLVVVPSA